MAAFGGSVDVMHQHGGQGVRVDAIFQRQVVGEVMVHDGDGLIGFGPADANLDVETPRSQHSRIDHVHAVGSTDYHHIVE